MSDRDAELDGRFPGAVPGKLIEYFFAGGTLSGISEYVSTHFTWHRFAAIQIWIFVLFIIYVSIEELDARLGNGELMKILFTGRHRK